MPEIVAERVCELAQCLLDLDRISHTTGEFECTLASGPVQLAGCGNAPICSILCIRS
jgi:hypothetical protein